MADFSCTDINGISVNQFVFNDDGTVSGIISTGSTTGDSNTNSTQTTYTEANSSLSKKSSYVKSDGTAKSPISEECCNSLNFIWESSTNTCYWSETCNSSPDFKVVMGAQGNEGAIFQVDDNETCQLRVKFKYLFQFDCDTLTTCTQSTVESSGEVGDIEEQISNVESQIQEYNEALESLTNQRSETDSAWKEAISDTNSQIEKQSKVTNTYSTQLEKTQQVKNKATDEKTISLLEEQELVVGEELEKNRSQLNELENTKEGQSQNKEAQFAEYLETINEYQQARSDSQAELAQLNEELTTLEPLTEPTVDGVSNCLSIFENLDVAVTLDKVVQRTNTGETEGQVSYESVQTLDNIITNDLFKIDNIVDYFDGNCDTGLYVTGSSKCIEQLNQCISYNLSGDCSVLSACTLNSNWLTYEFEITDEETLSGITNEEIKLGFLVRNCDCDFNILVDRIEINKVCTEVEKNDVYISKCPSFELERVVDNKKSWVATEEKEEREYFVKSRETDYDIKHHKLAINTKEIDLEVSPATAIETDMWCYLTDNPTMLDCSTGYTSTSVPTDINFNDILTAQTYNCDSGATSGTCSVYSTWGVSVELECENIYSNPSFYTGSTLIDAPTQQDYVNELENIASTLGLIFTTGSSEVTFIDMVTCSDTTYINKGLKVNLDLNINIECGETKSFQSGENFEFQDGTDYDFN
jgi:hypothetical protein